MTTATTARPTFASLEAFQEYAREGFKGFPLASAIRYEIALAGVPLTVDAHRDGRVTLVRAW
jgi:hypothetical protein